MLKTYSRITGFNLLSPCIAIALAVAIIFEATSVWAQDGGETNVNRRGGIDEIIVTATKREETLGDVPLAVTVFGGDYIEKSQIRGFDDLLSLIPGAVFFDATGPTGSFPSIRGSVSTDDSPAVELPVSFFVDDIYHGSAASFVTSFYDIGQVEVLRGPQGTTFGRNVVGGAILINSAKPDFDAGTSGKITLTGNNRPGFEVQGFLNHVISDKVAARLSFNTRIADGYAENIFNGNTLGERQEYSVRGQLLFRPTNALEIRVLGSYSDLQVDGLPRPMLFTGGVPASYATGGFNYNPDIRVTNQDTDGFEDRYGWRALLRADWEVSSNLLFTSITSGRGFDAATSTDTTGGPLSEFPNKLDSQKEFQFSQEVRLATTGNDNLIDWIFGAYYLHQNSERTEDSKFDGFPGTALGFLAFENPIVSQEIKVNSFAPFGEISINATDWLSVFAGARFTYDKKEGTTAHLGDPSLFLGPVFTTPIGSSWSAWTPRVGVELSPVEDVLLYATVSRGFKSGGFSNNANPALAAATPFDPEKVWSYELGTKSSLFDGKVVLNAALFQAKTTDLQVRITEVGANFIRNAGSSRARGIEAEVFVYPTEDLGFGATYGFLESKFQTFRNCTSAGADCSGNRVPYSPKHTATAFVEYTADIGNSGGAVSFRGEYQYRSRFNTAATNNTPFTDRTKRSRTINLFATYAPHADSSWDITFWGKNILDEEVASNIVNLPAFFLSGAELGAGQEASAVLFGEPRTFGASVSARF